MGPWLDKALRFRNYADELRLIAADKATLNNRYALKRIANDYERMAETLEAIDRSNRAMSKAANPKRAARS